MVNQNISLTMDEVTETPTINVTVTNADGKRSFLTFKVEMDEFKRPKGVVETFDKSGEIKKRGVSGQWIHPRFSPFVEPIASTVTPTEEKQAA